MGIHRATCHSILLCLVDEGLVDRASDAARYGLGPTLVRLGHRTGEAHEAFHPARKEMFGLARELDVSAFIAAPIGEETVILDLVRMHSTDLPIEVGARTPIRPPLGVVFYAWESASEIEARLEAVRGSVPDAEIGRYRNAIAAVRARGYSIGAEAEIGVDLESAIRRLEQSGVTHDRLEVTLELADHIRRAGAESGTAAPNMITAPIFDRSGRAVMHITIFARVGHFTEQVMPDHAHALLAAAGRVTAAIGGGIPAATSA